LTPAQAANNKTAGAMPCSGTCGGVKLALIGVGRGGAAVRWAPGTVIPRPPESDLLLCTGRPAPADTPLGLPPCRAVVPFRQPAW